MNQRPTEFEDLEHEITTLVRRAVSSGTVTARRVHPDLDASAYPLLSHVEANPGVRATELSLHFGIGAATVSRQLSRLEELGLIARTTDPSDSRGQLLVPTPEGRRRVAEARSGRVDALAEALAGWRPADVSRLAGLLGRYSQDITRWLQSDRD
ncbi:MarR family winged helix-turn-helix transcriptional regulator [Cellulomonas sp. PhB143]|uniref:MarR family winged helix-turn-helix transcriptional regulator n=1 Tax=Cellulomonas sp. PhB143 TaxID=2485186 RepID=UPI000F4936AC|nr:MarR family winged helix-turn-helix transcriptional regulator [Cellulomonas sp. PhB143]ROS76562.1 MarR family transcriptional regulator [Cellulomonas sp. PhB143]